MDPWGSQEGQQPQFITREQFEQIQSHHKQQLQQQRDILERQQQQIQQQQLEQQQMQQIHQQNLQNQQRQTSTPSHIESAIAIMSEGQKNLAESMSKLLIRLDETQQRTKTSRLEDERHQPPHLETSQPHERKTYTPSSPSEGAYARDPIRRLIIQKEPKIRDNLKFTGESRLLRQFLLDIYDTLEQYSTEFANDKRKINWIAGHFVSNSNDVSPAQSWFLSLLMNNAHIHGVVDPYANLKSLKYVLPALCTTEAFIKELILMFGDKTSSRTARDDLSKCKQGNTTIIDYNS